MTQAISQLSPRPLHRLPAGGAIARQRLSAHALVLWVWLVGERRPRSLPHEAVEQRADGTAEGR